jgi:hypothetical protein
MEELSCDDQIQTKRVQIPSTLLRNFNSQIRSTKAQVMTIKAAAHYYSTPSMFWFQIREGLIGVYRYPVYFLLASFGSGSGSHSNPNISSWRRRASADSPFRCVPFDLMLFNLRPRGNSHKCSEQRGNCEQRIPPKTLSHTITFTYQATAMHHSCQQ